MFKRLFSFGRARPQRHRWDLDTELFRWPGGEPWRIRDAVEGTSIMGATGSGKTSASGRLIAESFLRNGFGGLVLTVKPDERATWERYCENTGRSEDVVVFSPRDPWRFNFIDAELRRAGEGAGLTDNIINLLKKLVTVVGQQTGQSGADNSSDPFWPQTRDRLARFTIDLIRMSREPLTVDNIDKVISSSPCIHTQRPTDWLDTSYCVKCLRLAERYASDADQHEYDKLNRFWTEDFAVLTTRTRDTIVTALSSMIDILNRGLLNRMFSTTTNLTPEACAEGKIIIVDLPVKEFGDVGVIAQTLWKLQFQAAVERRSVGPETRPLFLAMDEGQNFISPHDLHFVTTARSSKVATLIISQSISNYYAQLGGDGRGKAQADGILANLNTKVFHSLSDPVTATWAADVIGRTRQFNINTSGTGHGGDFIYDAFMGHAPEQVTAGASEVIEHEVLPSRFSRLKKGGPDNGFLCDAYVVQNGQRFSTNGRKSWIKVALRQHN